MSSDRAAMATNESALVRIVRVLSDTYTDHGVMLWLTSKNRQLRVVGEEGGWTPAEFIELGRAAEVLECALRIEGSR